MAQPTKPWERRQHVVKINVCAISNNGFAVANIQIIFELGGRFELPRASFADWYVTTSPSERLIFAEAERIELPAAVLETAMLPLHHAPVRTPWRE